jgi:hypothetical protein
LIKVSRDSRLQLWIGWWRCDSMVETVAVDVVLWLQNEDAAAVATE